jgi:hypothetical protein
MEEKDNGLVKKLGWAYNIQDVWPSELQSIARYQELEDEGFGMLADKNDSTKIDISGSVVCPDGTVLTFEQINSYWSERYSKSGQVYNSTNEKDIMMHKAQMYYLGFKH